MIVPSSSKVPDPAYLEPGPLVLLVPLQSSEAVPGLGKRATRRPHRDRPGRSQGYKRTALLTTQHLVKAASPSPGQLSGKQPRGVSPPRVHQRPATRGGSSSSNAFTVGPHAQNSHPRSPHLLPHLGMTLPLTSFQRDWESANVGIKQDKSYSSASSQLVNRLPQRCS